MIELYQQRKTFRGTYEIIASYLDAALLFVNRQTCLTRIENPHRQSMTNDRFSNLIILAFELKPTENLDIEKLLRDFD